MQKRLLIHAAAALVSLPFLVAQVYAAGESGGSGGGTSGGASSGGGGSAETTAKCKKKGEVYDTKSKKCVLPKQGMLDDNNIYQAGHDLAMAGRYDEAIAVLTLAENKKDPRILNYLGYSHRKSGRVVVGLGYYEEALRQNPDYTLVPKSPLSDVARLIGGATLVVGADTGLTHLAAAFGLPTVAIFLTTEPGLTGPRGPFASTLIAGENGRVTPRAAFEEAARLLALKDGRA